MANRGEQAWDVMQVASSWRGSLTGVPLLAPE